MPQLETALTKQLGLTAPIVQAPIGSASCPELAAAVADAGGLGMLAITWRDEEATRAAIAETRRQTDGTFGVNIVVDPEAKSVPTETHVEICIETSVDVVSFSFGEAEPYIDDIQDYGGTVLQTVGSGEEAKQAVEAGVDAVVAQGWEAGGHVQSEIATLPLIPRVVDAVPETPVVAAGGIADGRGIAAVLTLGAAGAWLGTRFLGTKEANVHRRYQQRVIKANETDTSYGTPFDQGWPEVPHRVLENETTETWREAGRPETDRPGAREIIARTNNGTPIYRYEDSLAVPGLSGAVEKLPLYAGQSAGVTEDIKPADELVSALADETVAALHGVTEDQ